MSRTDVIQTNFTGGELDPELKARVHTVRYANAVEELTNVYVLPGGAGKRRSGLKFTDDEGAVTVNPIEFNIFRPDLGSVQQGYLIEFRSDNTIHFYTNSDRIGAVSIASPYTSDIDLIRYEQFDNTLYLVHPDFPPQMLTRTDDNNWTITAVSFATDATKVITNLASVTTTATATVTAHGYSTGMLVNIAGADQAEYNGDYLITVVDVNTFTYTFAGSATTPATGSITSGRIHWGTTGYPNSITFFEQRMILGGMASHPQSIIGTESGNILNIVTGVDDSDPFLFTMAAATSGIVHLLSTNVVVIMTRDKEFTIKGSIEKPLTPTNVHIGKHTPYGSRDTVRPIEVAGEILFVTRHGKKVRALSDRIGSTTQKKAIDISVVSAHLAALEIIDAAYQLEPDSVIWMVTATGVLLSLTYDKDSELLAWAKHTTDGLFKSVAVILYGDSDQVWVAVERDIDGSTKTYIEVFDPDYDMDAAIKLTDATAKVVWTGLSHLEGETVDVLADGVVVPQQVVTGGQITIPNAANDVQIGLHYKSTIKDLPPAIQTVTGTSIGKTVTVNKCTVLVYNTIGLKINGQIVPFRKLDVNKLDESVAPFSGKKEINLLSSPDGVVTIEQDQPLPFTVLGIIKEITVNG